jgi:hypothetical protein
MCSIKAFAASEDGSAIVDWIVLSAALVGIALTMMVVISSGSEDVSGNISEDLATAEPAVSPFQNNAGSATEDGAIIN